MCGAVWFISFNSLKSCQNYLLNVAIKNSTILTREQPKNMKSQCFHIQARGPGHLSGLPDG